MMLAYASGMRSTERDPLSHSACGGVKPVEGAPTLPPQLSHFYVKWAGAFMRLIVKTGALVLITAFI